MGRRGSGKKFKGNAGSAAPRTTHSLKLTTRGGFRKFRKKKGPNPPLSLSNANFTGKMTSDCIIITTLEKRLEGLGSYKNVLKIQEKKGARGPLDSAPPLNPPTTTSLSTSFFSALWAGTSSFSALLIFLQPDPFYVLQTSFTAQEPSPPVLLRIVFFFLSMWLKLSPCFLSHLTIDKVGILLQLVPLV